MGRGKSFVEVENLDKTINWLHYSHPKLERALKRGLKESMRPVLDDARSRARRIAYGGKRGMRDGKPKTSYLDSLSVASRQSGALYVLKSTDPAAGVKEFAHEGATRLVGPSARSSTQKARKRAGLPLGPGLREVLVGVPHRADPPRVMWPAVESNADEVRERVAEQMEKVLKEAERG